MHIKLHVALLAFLSVWHTLFSRNWYLLKRFFKNYRERSHFSCGPLAYYLIYDLLFAVSSGIIEATGSTITGILFQLNLILRACVEIAVNDSHLDKIDFKESRFLQRPRIATGLCLSSIFPCGFKKSSPNEKATLYSINRC